MSQSHCISKWSNTTKWLLLHRIVLKVPPLCMHVMPYAPTTCDQIAKLLKLQLTLTRWVVFINPYTDTWTGTHRHTRTHAHTHRTAAIKEMLNNFPISWINNLPSIHKHSDYKLLYNHSYMPQSISKYHF